jgi:hypothetical protein
VDSVNEGHVSKVSSRAYLLPDSKSLPFNSEDGGKIRKLNNQIYSQRSYVGVYLLRVSARVGYLGCVKTI